MSREESRTPPKKSRSTGQVVAILLLFAAGSGWLVVLFLRMKGPEFGTPAWVVDRTLAAVCGLPQAHEELARYYGKTKQQIEEATNRIKEAHTKTGLMTRFIRWEISGVYATGANEASVNVLADVLMRYGKGEPVRQRLNLLYRLRREEGKWHIVK